MEDRTELRITWGLDEEESMAWEEAFPETPSVDVAGFTAADLDRLRQLVPEGTAIRTEAGSVGKGAAGYGLTLLIDFAVGVGGGLTVELGKTAWRMIHEVSARRGGQPPDMRDPHTLGIVAAGAVDPATQATLAGCEYRGTVGITGSLDAGTDARDIWAACFDGDGYAIVIFMSPSGLCLGNVKVPAEFAMDESGEWIQRGPEQIAAWWRANPPND